METAIQQQLLLVVCPECGEPGILPPEVKGLFGQCNACDQMFQIQGEIVPVGYSCPIDKPEASPEQTAPEPEAATVPNEPASAPEVMNAETVSAPPRQRRWLIPAVSICATALMLAAIIAGVRLASPDDPAASPPPAGTLHVTLSETDNGYMWNRADYASRMALCENFARANNTAGGSHGRDAKWYYDAIHSFYNTNPQAPILQLEISQPVKLASLTDQSK